MSKIFIVGDSIAYGKWDPEGGWTARFRRDIDARFNMGKRTNLLVYALGVPSEPVVRLVDRLQSELGVRMDGNGKNLLILNSGLNDSCPNNKVTGELTPPETFRQAYGECIDIGRELGCEVVALGLTPVNPERSQGLLFSNELVAKYDGYVSEVCREKDVPKIGLFDTLTRENFPDFLDSDSAHPNGAGHELVFVLIRDFLDREGMIERLTSVI